MIFGGGVCGRYRWKSHKVRGSTVNIIYISRIPLLYKVVSFLPLDVSRNDGEKRTPFELDQEIGNIRGLLFQIGTRWEDCECGAQDSMML